MLPGTEKLTLNDRILHLAKVLSTAHRLLDGVPGKLLLPVTVLGKDVGQKELADYPHVLPDENGKEPLMFRAIPMSRAVEWVKTSPANYRQVHTELSAALGEWHKQHGKVHGVQAMGLATRLWKTPNNLRYRGDYNRPTPFPQRTIRDR